MGGAYPALVFVIGDVAHVMDSILDAPVPAHEREDEFGGGMVGGQGGQAVDGLVLDLAGFADPALTLDAKGHLAVGHSDLVAVGGEVEHPAASFLEPPVSFVRGAASGCSLARTSGRSQSSPAKSRSTSGRLSLTAVIT